MDQLAMDVSEKSNDLPAAALSLPADEWEAARRYLSAALAPSTRYAYFRALVNFGIWCEERGLCAIPAEADVIATYIAFEADRGISPSAIELKCSAIGAAHDAAGLDVPTKVAVVRRTMSGIRRTKSGKRLARDPLLADDIIKIVKDIPTWRYAQAHGKEQTPSMRGLRDRALIILGFSLAARRSELAALEIEDLDVKDEGLLVTFRKSKTDQEGEGAKVAVPRGNKLCPVALLQDWLDAAHIIEGPVFRAISKADRVLPRAIDGRQVSRVLQARAKAAGIDDKAVSGHSLRSGFLTTAAQNRASVWKMAEVSRHKDLRQLKAYVQETELFDDHAGKGNF